MVLDSQGQVWAVVVSGSQTQSHTFPISDGFLLAPRETISVADVSTTTCPGQAPSSTNVCLSSGTLELITGVGLGGSTGVYGSVYTHPHVCLLRSLFRVLQPLSKS